MQAGKQKQTLMYEDTQNAWASMLLYGIEVDLMVFLCWCFAWGYHVFDHTTSARPLPSPPYLHSLASVAVLNEALCV